MTLPSPPTAVVATAGAASATLSWNSAFGGGAPVSSYSILVTTNGTDAGSGPTTIDAGVVYCLSTSAELTGLVNGFEYVFLVTADNGFGSSSPAASNPVTPASDIPIP